MKFFRIIIIIAISSLLTGGLYNLIVQKSALQKEIVLLKTKTERLSGENLALQANIEYFKRPENLLKELKSQFNYRETGEKLIIIVPGATSTR